MCVREGQESRFVRNADVYVKSVPKVRACVRMRGAELIFQGCGIGLACLFNALGTRLFLSLSLLVVRIC